MKYRILLSKHAEKDLDKLSDAVADRILLKLQKLCDKPKLTGIKRLKGSNDLYRLRVGDYRVIFSIFEDRLIIFIVRVGHRPEIYRSNLN